MFFPTNRLLSMNPEATVSTQPVYPTIEDVIGKTPLVALQRIGAQVCRDNGNVILGKLEGKQPCGFGEGPPAASMIQRAQERGDIQPGDTLIEATSGNTGIALAMAAAIKGYRMVLIMPEDLSIERAQTMKAFGAELILTPKSGGMEYARDLADQMCRRKARAACWTSLPMPTTPASTLKPQGPKSGSKRRAASRISSVPWAPRAPSQVCRASSSRRTRM